LVLRHDFDAPYGFISFYYFAIRVFSTYPPSASQQILHSPRGPVSRHTSSRFSSEASWSRGEVCKRDEEGAEVDSKKENTKKKYFTTFTNDALRCHGTIFELWRGLHCFMLPSLLKGRPVASIHPIAITLRPQAFVGLFGYLAPNSLSSLSRMER